ncbi:hypothetical protein MWN34_07445 [Ancylobacter sp. 6x-1]|uniref:Uncharacterized protein n=1 Tax=Ancylobacter crimeensis TaxID=2579147 RepID=A0ABT0D9W3_9HYPH|nr:hypothetical protein [Ancylobacter crimeensis]MCK0196746.1 hypothetical protein [Ancylobacter crimeensis]
MTIKSNSCQMTVPCIDEPENYSEDEQLCGCLGAIEPWEHPDLLRAFRGMVDYHRWVEMRLIPIAFAWMEEHRAAMLERIPEDRRSDIGISVETAFQLIKKTEFWEETKKRIAEAPPAEEIHRNGKANPMWIEMSRKYLAAERELSPNLSWDLEI